LALAAPSVAPPLKAPPGLTAFRSFGADQGLTNLSGTALAQDPEGFLWLGTEDGLFRLEGDRFRRFGEEDGLPSGRISENGLSAGLKHGLCVQTNQGMAFWNGQRFLRPSTLGLAPWDGRRLLPPSGLRVQDMDDQMGICLAQGGMILSNRHGKAHFLSLDGEPFKLLDGLPWGNALSAGTYDAARDRLLVCVRQELWMRQKGVWTHRDLSKPLGQDVQALWADARGRIWLRTPERLARLAAFEAPLEVLVLPVRLAMVNAASIGEDALGRVWTNTSQGLVWIDEQAVGLIGEREGLPQGGAVVLRVDNQGTVWIAGEGAHKLLGEGLWTGYTRRQGLPTDVVWSITRTRDGLLWAGTAAGLAAGDERGWKVLPGTLSNQFMALEEDSDGNLWAGHTPSVERPTGLSVRSKGTLALRPVVIPGLSAQSRVNALLTEGPTLWLGTSRNGLFRASRQGIRLQAEPVKIGTWPAEGSINRIVADGRGGLWVGGRPGLAHWNGQTWATLDKASGLSEDKVLTVAPLPSGEAWVSYEDVKGLTKVGVREGRLQPVETLRPPHPLVQSPIVTLVARPDGELWVGTSHGLLGWNGQRLERYGRHTGFPGEDCAQFGLWFDPNGDIWVGLGVGLVRGRLGLRHGHQTPPPAVLFEATRGDGQSLLTEPGLQRVPWSGRTLTFRYGPMGSLRTEALAYQVRLVGLEDTWRNTTLPEARYPGLGAGSYRFEVRTVNSVDETGETRALNVEILPPWWRRAWFLLLAGLSLLGLAFQVVHWRTVILRRRNIQLETLVRARTEELEIANHSLLEASLVDPLTGLHNRRFLTMTMPEEEIRLHRMFRNHLLKGESPLGRNEDLVLFLGDLDYFKHVNDTYGHAAGDLVLQETAQVLRATSRTSDTLVRWGGEEFLLVAKRSDREKAHQIAEKLCQALRDHSFTLPDGRVLRCTISIGYAAFPILDQNPEAFTWEDTLQVADQCLYAAKHAGRDGWVGVHTPGPVDTLDLVPRLRVDLEGLVREGHIRARSSFPEDKVFRG
jgi:diguanylate cyclase (GGDEF)-like protein